MSIDMELPVHARFRTWFKWLGISQGELADRLGCNQSVISNVLAGKRRVASVDIAAAVEQQSADWPDGPILAAEWGMDRRKAS